MGAPCSSIDRSRASASSRQGDVSEGLSLREEERLHVHHAPIRVRYAFERFLPRSRSRVPAHHRQNLRRLHRHCEALREVPNQIYITPQLSFQGTLDLKLQTQIQMGEEFMQKCAVGATA